MKHRHKDMLDMEECTIAYSGGVRAQTMVADMLYEFAKIENNCIVYEEECHRIIRETGASFKRSDELIQ